MTEIIKQTAPGSETEFERDYIYNFVLSSAEKIEGNKIIVFSSDLRRKRPQDVDKDDIVLHLSNEHLRYNYHFLSKDNIVLRSLYHPFIRKHNCYAIPLGWQTGFGNKENVKGNHDKYIWTFIGQLKGYRKPMADTFKDFEPNYSRYFNSWAAKELTKAQIKEIYLNSAFALSPFGNIHPDCFRVMEVLEWGCIPVVIEFLGEDYFKYIYGDHPFIVGRNWEDAKMQVVCLWSDKKALLAKQKETEIWYANFKKDLSADINDILAGKEPTRCSQWKYQQEGHHNIKMLILWYLHFYVGYDYLILKRIFGQWINRIKKHIKLD